MNTTEKILKAKVQLTLSEPFFSSIALGLEYREEPSIKTADVDGKIIRYNPTFIDTLDLDETVFLLGHEVMHVTNLHHTRIGNRNHRKWNRAGDYSINLLLKDSGLKVIQGALLDEQYRDMSAEQIYNLIPDEPEDDEPGEGDPGGCGGVRKFEDQIPTGIEKEEQEVREKVSQAMNNARKAGKLSGDMERAISEALKPKVDWKEVLARFLCEVSRDDYSFRKPNPRFIHTGFYLPSLYNEDIGNYYVFGDSSGSVSQRQINMICSETQEIVNTFNKGFTFLSIDTKVQHVQEIEPDEKVNIQMKGFGGTDFIPGFNWLEENEIVPKVVIYITDGYCDSFPTEPNFPVLWIIIDGKKNFSPPFGEVIEVND